MPFRFSNKNFYRQQGLRIHRPGIRFKGKDGIQNRMK
jgi:hypothetical protein